MVVGKIESLNLEKLMPFTLKSLEIRPRGTRASVIKL